MALEFLDQTAAAADEPVAVGPVVETVEVPVIAEVPAEIVPEKTVAPEGYVPLATVLDTRDKLKEERQARQKLEEQLRVYQAPPPSPDDPDYVSHQLQQTQMAVASARLDMSEDNARDKFGDETVDAAKEWALQRFSENPAFQAEVLGQRNPYGYAVQQFQRQQALGKLGDPSEVEGYLAWKAAQAGQAAAPAAVPETPAIPSRSLASAPGAGGGVDHAPTGPGVGYAALFGSKNE